MRKRHIKHIFLICCLYGLFAPYVSDASTPFSKYGVIQNVQNYSTNPFWNADSPYNQRMPQPVYAQGPSVQTDDCQRTVASLIAVQCRGLNNCANTKLTDIRPAIMVQLSRMSNGNYATSCAGYIDGAFNDYRAQNVVAQPNTGTAFPTVATPTAQIKIDTTTRTPNWATEIEERRQELAALQAENGANDFEIQKTDFPTTYADLSFTERMANEAAGYEPYEGKRAYQEINIEDLDEYYKRQEDVAQAKKEYEESMAELEKAKKCRKNPNAPECTNNNDDDNNDDDNNNDDNESDNEEETPVTPMSLTGKEHFMFLFQPDDAAWEKGEEIETSQLSKNTFWNKKCSDHSLAVIDDDSVINKNMSNVFSELTFDTTDFYLYINTTNYLITSRNNPYRFRPDYSGLLCRDDTPDLLSYTDLESAKLKATAIQESLNGTTCKGLKLYIVTFPLPKNFSETPKKITIVDGPFGIE